MTITVFPTFNYQAMDLHSTQLTWNGLQKSERFSYKKIPPLHPEASPVETFLKPLGNTMKIANENKENKREFHAVPVVCQIISGSCEPILSGNAALHLEIIRFNKTEYTFQPILMIEQEYNANLQRILSEYPQNF